MIFCEPVTPKKYWVNCFSYECKQCGGVFNIIFPNGYDLVKFREIDGCETKWLPSFGKGGYLDLMVKLLPEHSQNDEVTIKKTKLFMKELNKYCEPSENGNGFDIEATNYDCQYCNSQNTKCLSEDVLTNPSLSWLKISSSLIK